MRWGAGVGGRGVVTMNAIKFLLHMNSVIAISLQEAGAVVVEINTGSSTWLK